MAGYYGWAILFGMSVLNTCFYGDVFYRRVTQGRFASFGTTFRTFYGAQGGLRPLVNFGVWAVIGLFSAMAHFEVPALFTVMSHVSGWMGLVYTFRTVAILFFMVFGMLYDGTTDYVKWTNWTDLFDAQYAWGDRMKLYD